jgi:hypothetical protein
MAVVGQHVTGRPRRAFVISGAEDLEVISAASLRVGEVEVLVAHIDDGAGKATGGTVKAPPVGFSITDAVIFDDGAFAVPVNIAGCAHVEYFTSLNRVGGDAGGRP